MTEFNSTKELLYLFFVLQVQPHTPCPLSSGQVLLSRLQLLPTQSLAAVKLTVTQTKCVLF